MPKNTESLNRTLFELLHSKGLDPTMLSTSGKEIPTPEEAEVFQFNFVKDEEDYGTVTISIDGLHKLTIYFSDEVANSEKEESESDDVSWYQLLNQLKRFSQKYQLSFELRNVSNLKHDMAKREYMKKKESIAEGYYPMGKKASYSDAVPSVKIVLQHSRQIEEGEQRYRNVERIFLENEQGERFLAPTIRPGIARVYARHIAEGGMPHDDRWNHIGSLCEEYSKMAGFVRATRNGQFTESTQKLIAEGINHYQSLRESLGRLAGHRGYNAYFESWSPPLMEDESDMTNINELFVQETVDPRIENVMPILSKLQKKISEMSEVNELSEWADKLIEGDEDIEDNEAADAADNAESELTEEESLTSNNPQGVPESEEHSPVTGAITRRILMQRQDLLKKYGPVAVMQAIDDVADFAGDAEEIGSSDVSGWIKQIERSLGGGGVDEAVRAGFVTPDWMKTPQQGAYGDPTDQLGRPYNQAQRDELAASVKQNRKDNKAFSGGLPTKGADSAAFGWDGVWKAPDVKNTSVRAQQDKVVAPAVDKTYDRTEPANPKKWKTLPSAGDGKGIADEGLGDMAKKVFDKLGGGSEEDLLKDLKAKAGVRNPENGKPSMAQSDVEKRTDEVDMGQADSSLRNDPKQNNDKMDHFTALGKASKKMGHDHFMDVPDDKLEALKAMVKRFRAGEEVDESALQAYLGDKKYGEDGMDALRKAGQEHASEKTMQNIRAQYSDKEEPVKEDNGDTEIRPGMKVSQGTVVKVNGNTVTVKTSNGDMMTMNMHDVDQAVSEGEFAGDYATGEAGQWRNKGPKANKPATIGDLVGEGQDDLDTIRRLVRK